MSDPLPTSDDARSGDGARADEVARFVRRVRRILEEPQVAARVSAAGITVRIDLQDVPGSSLTLLFDRTPPAVEVGVRPTKPTVRLALHSRDLAALLDQGTHLPMAILAGEVVFEGAVRKLLRVMPILRGGALGPPDEEQD